MAMFKAKAIMSKELLTIQKDTPVYKAIEILIENNVTGLPVVSDDMHVIGMVTEKDMLHLLSENENIKKTVKEIMSTDIQCFDENISIIDICDCLNKNNFRRVPILSNEKIVGIISRKDIISFILKLKKK